MPFISGIELISIVRKDYPLLPILCLTRQDDVNLVVQAMQAGADHYALKPFDQLVHTHIDRAIHIRASRIAELKEANPFHDVVREIEFTEDTHQAGLSLLNYFGTVVRQKYPNINVKVTIQQNENKVKLIIETPDGSREEVEHTLEQYGLVIAGKIPPNELLSDPFHIMQLQNKLKLSEVELNMTKDLVGLQQRNYESRISFLEHQLERLNNQLSNGLKREEKIHELLWKYLENSGLTHESETLVHKLVTAIEDVEKSNQDEIRMLLSEIRKSSPTLISQISELVTNTAYGVAGNTAFLYLHEALKAFR